MTAQSQIVNRQSKIKILLAADQTPAIGLAARNRHRWLHQRALSHFQYPDLAWLVLQSVPCRSRAVPSSTCGRTATLTPRWDALKNAPPHRGWSSGNEVLTVGLTLSVLGVGWAVPMDALYGLVVFAGWFFDVVIYTIWLKRRTCWSIVWGGISGAMPILAGRVLGLGQIDLDRRHARARHPLLDPHPHPDLQHEIREGLRKRLRADLPSTYGLDATRATIAISSVLAALAMIIAGSASAWRGASCACLVCSLRACSCWQLPSPSNRPNASTLDCSNTHRSTCWRR